MLLIRLQHISLKAIQHETINLRIFMSCVKIRNCETFTLCENSAVRKVTKKFVKDNFVDHRNSTNLPLARSKMVKPTYFLTNCTIVFGSIFHRLCKIFVPITLFTNLYAVFFTRHCYSFGTIRFFPFGILSVSKWTTYFQNIRNQDSI